MKHTLFAFIFLVLILSCSKNDDSQNNENNDKSLIAIVDDISLSFENGEMSGRSYNALSNAWYLDIECTINSNACFFIRKRANSSTEINTIGESEFFSLEYIEGQESWINIDTQNPNGIAPGELIFTQITDTNAIGTFTFIGYNSNDDSTKTITQGSFNIELE